MKKFLSLTISLAFLLAGNVIVAQKMTDAERSKAIEYMKSTQAELLKMVDGLSEAQLNYKADEESWSVAECVEHIAITESGIFGIFQGTLKTDANPSLRDSVAMSDDALIGLITSRERKVKTREEMVPTGKFGSYEGSLKEFKTQRSSNMDFVKNCEEDVRSRYFDFPFGKVDAYQLILFVAGHSARHTSQIKEVMGSEGFPER